jgi:tyrosyl-tRNA synthetase
VGDPSGRSAERPVLPPEEIDRNAETFKEQAFKVLDPERAEVRFNGEWLDMEAEALFRLARTATVAQILERDDFAKRFAANEPISVLELLYPLLQGYDSVAIDADVETGGTDQKFNLLMGRSVQQAYGKKPQSILTMPILPGIDGVRRMSKSVGNYVGITEPPEEIFGKLMRVPDDAMPIYYDLLLGDEPDSSEPPVAQKRSMARRITAQYHGEDAASQAEAHFDRLHVTRELPDEIDEAQLPGDDPVHVPGLLREHFGMSAGEGRRLISGGGVRVDGEQLSDLDVPAAQLDGAVLQVGKRRFKRFRAAS